MITRGLMLAYLYNAPCPPFLGVTDSFLTPCRRGRVTAILARPTSGCVPKQAAGTPRCHACLPAHGAAPQSICMLSQAGRCTKVGRVRNCIAACRRHEGWLHAARVRAPNQAWHAPGLLGAADAAAVAVAGPDAARLIRPDVVADDVPGAAALVVEALLADVADAPALLLACTGRHNALCMQIVLLSAHQGPYSHVCLQRAAPRTHPTSTKSEAHHCVSKLPCSSQRSGAPPVYT